MASSGTLISDKWNKAYWSFEWSSSVVSPGITEVKWELRAKGRSSSPTKYYTKIRLFINETKEYELWDESATFTGTKYDSGSFTVNHDVDGNGNFNVRLYVPKIYDALDWYTTEDEPSLDTNKPYSACGAATLELDSSKVIVPNGSVTLSWRDAKPGTANPIVGYDIYRCITTEEVFDESNATLIASKGATENTYTDNFINNSQSRDKNIIYQIITIGQATAEANTTNYNSDYSNQILVEINDLPDSPKLKENSVIVPSGGGAVTIKLIIESKSSQTTESAEVNQSIVYYYSTNSVKPNSLSGLVKVEGDTIQTPVINKETTFYFWSYDGLEFSETSANFTVYKNSKPKISFLITGDELESVNNQTGRPYVNIVKITNLEGIDGIYQDNVYNFYLGYGTENNVEKATWQELHSFNSSSSKVPVNDDLSFDIRTEIGFSNYCQNGVYYWIKGQRKDKLEFSDEVYTDAYYITKIPALQKVYNNTLNSNVTGFESFFLNKLYLRFDYDTGYDKVYLKIGTKAAAGYNITSSTNDGVSYVHLNTSDNSAYNRGDSISIDHSFDNVTYIKDVEQITKIYSLDNLLKNLTSSWGGNTWKVYENIGSASIIVAHGNQYNNLKQLGLTENSVLYLNFKGSSTKKEIVVSQKTDNSTNEISYYSLSLENDYFNLLPNSFNFNGANAAQLELSITNAFDEHYTIDSEIFTVDFRTKSFDPNFYFTYNTSGGLVSPLTYLKELIPLYLNGSIKSYNTNPKGQLYINRSTEESWQPYGSAFYFIETASIGPTPGNPKTYGVSNQLIQTIGKILTEKYTASFKIVITTDVGADEAYKLEYTFLENKEIRGHFLGNTSLNNGQYEAQNNELLLKFNTKTLGLYADEDSENASVSMNLYVYQADDPSKSKKYQIAPSTTTLPAYKDFNEFSQVLNDFTFEGAAYAKIIVETTLETDAGFSTRVSYETNEISFFNIVPTISYRQNQIGINYQNVENTDCILALGEYQGKTALRYYGATDENPYGKIVGFILDGGSW